jgi:hypothetical protein
MHQGTVGLAALQEARCWQGQPGSAPRQSRSGRRGRGLRHRALLPLPPASCWGCWSPPRPRWLSGGRTPRSVAAQTETHTVRILRIWDSDPHPATTFNHTCQESCAETAAHQVLALSGYTRFTTRACAASSKTHHTPPDAAYMLVVHGHHMQDQEQHTVQCRPPTCACASCLFLRMRGLGSSIQGTATKAARISSTWTPAWPLNRKP